MTSMVVVDDTTRIECFGVLEKVQREGNIDESARILAEIAIDKMQIYVKKKV